MSGRIALHQFVLYIKALTFGVMMSWWVPQNRLKLIILICKELYAMYGTEPLLFNNGGLVYGRPHVQSLLEEHCKFPALIINTYPYSYCIPLPDFILET